MPDRYHLNDADFSELKAILSDCRRILIAGHVSPDGDAVGACFALALSLKAAGKEPLVLLEPYAERFDFLPGKAFVYTGSPADIPPADVFIAVDTAAKGRLSPAALAVFDAAPLTVSIDHHISNNGYADRNYIFPAASSASEVMADVVQALGPITRDIAECLFTGLIFDTGGFRNSATTAKTMRCAAALFESGIRFTEIFQTVMEARSFCAAKLFGVALQKLCLTPDGAVAYSVLTAADFKTTGAAYTELDGIVAYMLSLRGVEAALLVTERADRLTKVSLRSRHIDVNAVAGRFGGGGHTKAAGATVSIAPEAACALFCAALSEAWAAFP